MTLRDKLAAILLSLSVILSLAVAGIAQTKTSTSTSSKSKSSRTSVTEEDNNFNWHHHDGSVDMHVAIRGKVEFTDDYSDIRSISSGGEIRVRDERGGIVRKFEATETGGSLTRTYSVNGQTRPIDEDARKWLAKTLDQTVRASGYDAPARVQRILKQSGPQGVLSEIPQLSSDYVKRIYFDELFAQGQLDPESARQTLRLAATEISSDYEKAQLLLKMSNSYLVNDEMRRIYIDGVNTIHSDYERGRALSALLRKGDLSKSDLLFAIKSAGNIRSDYERAQLLIKIANGFALDQAGQTAYIDAVASIGSDYEKGRVLSALLKKETGKETLLFTLKSASTISSDYEKAQLLLKVAHAGSNNDDAVRNALIQAARTIGSEYERGRVLSAVIK